MKKSIVPLFLFAILLVFVSCSMTRDAGSISVGMDEEDVFFLVGMPDLSGIDSEGLYNVYRVPAFTGSQDMVDVRVNFEAGKVASLSKSFVR